MTFPIYRYQTSNIVYFITEQVVAGSFLFLFLLNLERKEIKMYLNISLVMTWQINNEHYFQQTYEGPQHFTHEFFMWLLISNLAPFYFQFQFNIWRNTLEFPLQGSFN